jgi:hypothetical protein
LITKGSDDQKLGQGVENGKLEIKRANAQFLTSPRYLFDFGIVPMVDGRVGIIADPPGGERTDWQG